MDLNKLKKAEFVQIILRKDDVERNLRADIKGMEESLLKKKEEISRLVEDVNEQVEDVDRLGKDCQKLNCTNYILENKITRLRRRNYIWFTTTLLATIGLVVSLVF